MADAEGRIRVYFDVDQPVKDRIDKIPHGIKGKIFESLAIRFLDQLDKEGNSLLISTLDRNIEIKAVKEGKK